MIANVRRRRASEATRPPGSIRWASTDISCRPSASTTVYSIGSESRRRLRKGLPARVQQLQDLGQQEVGMAGLLHVGVGAFPERLLLFLPAAQDDDRHPPRLWIGLQLPDHLVAVH